MLRALSIVTALMLAASCSSPDFEARSAAAGPDRAGFPPVAAALMQRCGSLDCHGSPYRNLRLLGFGGARLADTDRPDFPETTAAEKDADYDAVVGLEPEIMHDVVAAGGADDHRLVIVRKAENLERHKGGQRIVPGDDADLCLHSWLAGVVDEAACERVVNAP